MNKELETKLEEIRQKPVPQCSANIEANVLRRVRTVKSALAEESFLNWITGLIPNTSFSLSAIALVIAVSTLATMTTALVMTSDRKSEINRALGFDTITLVQVVHLEKP